MREWPHEKEQCMKTFAFERWCDRLQLPTATRDFLLRLRSSPPVRRVQGRLLNVCGTYASRKMGVSIQFESHTVELWAIYTMEYDREVLEFFDQPYQLELHYQGPSGRPTKALHTPDFLVLRKDGASFEEWKPEEKLLELMVTHPGRYQRDERGKWRCPPGEAAAESLGLSYRVRSSEELHPGYIRNLIFLEEYFFDCVVPNGALAHILEAVEATPGITLSALREQDEHLRVDHVYALIARNRLYVDLYTFWLKISCISPSTWIGQLPKHMPFCETAKGTPRLDSEMEETSPSQLTHCSIGTASDGPYSTWARRPQRFCRKRAR